MWVRFHDGMPDDPDVDRLSDGAFRVYVAAVCYAQRIQSDGTLTRSQLTRTVPKFRPAHLTELTSNPLDHPDGPLLHEATPGTYRIRNFTRDQKTSDHWTKRREADAARMAEWRRSNGKDEPK